MCCRYIIGARHLPRKLNMSHTQTHEPPPFALPYLVESEYRRNNTERNLLQAHGQGKQNQPPRPPFLRDKVELSRRRVGGTKGSDHGALQTKAHVDVVQDRPTRQNCSVLRKQHRTVVSMAFERMVRREKRRENMVVALQSLPIPPK